MRVPSASVCSLPIARAIDVCNPALSFGKFLDDCATHSPIEEGSAVLLELSSEMPEEYEDEATRVLKSRSIHGIRLEASRVPETTYAHR